MAVEGPCSMLGPCLWHPDLPDEQSVLCLQSCIRDAASLQLWRTLSLLCWGLTCTPSLNFTNQLGGQVQACLDPGTGH